MAALQLCNTIRPSDTYLCESNSYTDYMALYVGGSKMTGQPYLVKVYDANSKLSVVVKMTC